MIQQITGGQLMIRSGGSAATARGFDIGKWEKINGYKPEMYHEWNKAHRAREEEKRNGFKTG